MDKFSAEYMYGSAEDALRKKAEDKATLVKELQSTLRKISMVAAYFDHEDSLERGERLIEIESMAREAILKG